MRPLVEQAEVGCIEISSGTIPAEVLSWKLRSVRQYPVSQFDGMGRAW